jgi:glycosyltransferase involved in cell wall biosynthesis
MKIYIHGADKIGWSLDSDRHMVCNSIKRLNYDVEESPIGADIIHNLCWQELFSGRSRLLLLKKRLAATCSSFLDPDKLNKMERANFIIASSRVKTWVSPSRKQQAVLDKMGLKNIYIPFTIDCQKFSPELHKTTREELAAGFNINYELIKNKMVLGSFQRDSLGSNLQEAKWQKGADLLIEIIKDLPKANYILLLAGPRRHYLIRECKNRQIPYLYIGRETDGDDIYLNALPIERMPSLYAICDTYIISSRSEGGPKAALETVAMETPVISSDVGLAAEFIDRKYIYKNVQEAKKMIYDRIEGLENRDEIFIKLKEQRSHLLQELAENKIDKYYSELYNATSNRKN